MTGSPVEALADGADLETARRLLLDGADADRLYGEWFHRRTGRMLHWPEPPVLLSAALDPARFEAGWTVAARVPDQPGMVEAVRGEERRVVAPPQLASVDLSGATLRPGIAVLVHPLAAGEVSGFWHLWSPGWLARPPDMILRFYVPIDPAAAPAFARAVAASPANAVWSAKVLTGEHDAGRRDGALLYLSRAADLTTEWIARLLDGLADLASGPLPPFVTPFACTLGHAPDPGAGRSFGQALTEVLAVLHADAADPARFRRAVLAAVAALPGFDQ